MPKGILAELPSRMADILLFYRTQDVLDICVRITHFSVYDLWLRFGKLSYVIE